MFSGKVAPNKDKDAIKPEAESTKKAEARGKRLFVALLWGLFLGAVCIGAWVQYRVCSCQSETVQKLQWGGAMWWFLVSSCRSYTTADDTNPALPIINSIGPIV